MAWEHLSISRPHLVYIILGGFTSLFMLCSSVIKERLYIGEATVATICGIIFGPHGANLINPSHWGNTDLITLEFSRIVLVVQCFAVGVELPKSYMERHWKSVTFLLVPVMAFGWIVTSLFIWWMFLGQMDWLDSLCCAACVTATDPVLASSVVGKGKFAKRVPKHLRDLLSAESGCNDGMAFPFIYLALYLIRYRPHAGEVAFHWICFTILYECIFGAVYGVLIGYGARRAIRYAHERDLIDRESFLVFYFVLALFCAGSGSILGMDDLLIGFACGVGFSNDGWFQEKTEESHVSNVIDLLINLAFFVYFGTIIPWEQYNSIAIGTTPWRLVVIAIFVMFFRRIPIMMVLKPIIPDIKTWREALFAGHFGPIGVGAIFVAILARAELENESTEPLAVLPPPGSEHMNIIQLIWPITTFLVICSIVVHGSSIAVFTLGKHINTLTLTLSYTQADEGPSWMDRLPRIQSRSKSSMSLRNPESSQTSLEEKGGGDMGAFPQGIPGNFLRRQKEEDAPSRPSSKAGRRRRRWDLGIGPGGPVSQSAIMPASRRLDASEGVRSSPPDVEALASGSQSPYQSSASKESGEPQGEVYQEGDKTIVEDEEGNVLEVRDEQDASERQRVRRVEREAPELLKQKDVEHGVSQEAHAEGHDTVDVLPSSGRQTTVEDLSKTPGGAGGSWWNRMESLVPHRRPSDAGPSTTRPEKRHGPARAYTFGNTVIVEDEDGEVIKQYEIPRDRGPGERKPSSAEGVTGVGTKSMLFRVGSYLGGHGGGVGRERQPSTTATAIIASSSEQDDSGAAVKDREMSMDDGIRFTISSGRRRMRKDEFIEELQRMDTRSRIRAVEQSDVPDSLRQQVQEDARKESAAARSGPYEGLFQGTSGGHDNSTEDLDRLPSRAESIPIPAHAVSDTLAHFAFDRGGRETAAQRRRRLASQVQAPPRSPSVSETEEEEGGEEGRRNMRGASTSASAVAVRPSPERARAPSSSSQRAPQESNYLEEVETAAERRRRQAALGLRQEEDSSDDEDGKGFRDIRGREARSRPQASSASVAENRTSIRFAENDSQQASSGMRLRWGEDVGRRR